PTDWRGAGRRIAGMLLEARMRGGAAAGGSTPNGSGIVTIVGVGINLGQREFPPDLADGATSVALETGRAPSREAVLTALLEEFDVWRARLEAQRFEPVPAA